MNRHFLSKRLTHQLGFAGLIPFVLLSFGCWVAHPDWMEGFIRAQIAYGIAILSFVGGLHWGVVLSSPELNADQTKRALVWGVVPTLIAWCSTFNFGIGFLVLMFGFIAAYQVDKRLYAWYDMPAWVLVLRLQLTWVVVGSLAVTLLAVNVRA